MFPSESFFRRPAFIVFAGLTIIVALLALRYCSTPQAPHYSSPRNSGGDTIDVAIEYGPSTLYTTGESDTLRGFAYRMLLNLAGDSMVMKFHPVSSASTAIEWLRNGYVDLVAAEMATMGEFDSTYRFSQSVRLDRQILVQLADSAGKPAVSSVLDLAGKSVWVPSGSPMLSRLRNLETEIGNSIDIITDSVHGSEQLIILVAVGEIPYAVVNRRIALSLAGDYPQLNIDRSISFTQFQSWLMRSTDTCLAARIDSAIVRFRSTELYRKLDEEQP